MFYHFYRINTIPNFPQTNSERFGMVPIDFTFPENFEPYQAQWFTMLPSESKR